MNNAKDFDILEST